jgi:TonB family protein
MTRVHSLHTLWPLGASLVLATLLEAAPKPASPPAPPASSSPPATASVPAVTSTPEERLQVYHEFRQLFDAHNYKDALEPAQRLVTLTEAATGPTDLSLATPLLNLATTQYQLGTFDEAEAGYLRTVKIIEEHTGGFTKSLIQPLRGLGLTYLAAGEAESAIEPLRRAVDITRKIDGLFNVAQLDLLDPLIRAYGQVNKPEDAEREQIYSYRVSENQYGKDSVEVTPALLKLARWYTEAGRYTAGRQYYGNVLAIVQKAAGHADVRMVPALLGIAETYRLEFIFGPEQADDGNAAASNAPGGTLMPSGTPMGASAASGGSRLNPTGEDALRTALKLIESGPSPDPTLHARTLVALGDWLLLGGSDKESRDMYHRAWPFVQVLTPPENAAFAQPTQIYYRTPLTGQPARKAKPENIVEGFVDVEFTVTTDGRVVNARTSEKKASDSQERAVLNAIKKARYRPRLERGEPVESPGTHLRQQVFSVK